MFYSLDLNSLPKIEERYIVVRKTIWEIADPYNILIVILEGQCKVELGKKIYHLKKYDALFIPQNQVYKRTPVNDENCKFLYLHFSTNENARELHKKEVLGDIYTIRQKFERQLISNTHSSVAPVNQIYLNDVNKISSVSSIEALEKIVTNIDNFGIAKFFLINVYFLELLASISAKIIDEISNYAVYDENTINDIIHVPHKLKKAVNYIKQHKSSKIALDDLCTYCNISKSQLNRYFKETFDKTPMQYTIEFKLNCAKELFLNAPQLSISNVANELGFDDQHYFSRIFTKVTGETPSFYKARIHNFSEQDNDKH